MRGVALELAVRGGSFLERPKPPRGRPIARGRGLERADGDEQHRGAHERDEQLGVDLGRQAADGSDEPIIPPAQRTAPSSTTAALRSFTARASDRLRGGARSIPRPCW